ncbi:MAG: PilZ domain-containing protein [Bdellovibrionaceae bacterium]|nr:PilZ domain-containing protein [Pseudobdellovibrionaceae bacterium]
MGDILKFPGSKVQSQTSEANGVENAPESPAPAPDEGRVLDVTQRIQERQAEDRRRVKRVVLNEFISAHVFVAGRGLVKITMKDIHDGGLAFDIDERQGQFTRGETLEIRFYLNHETYFKFNVQVAHSSFVENESVYRHGTAFIGESLNNVALHHFTQFLQTISASLRTDTGDRIVSNIYS